MFEPLESPSNPEVHFVSLGPRHSSKKKGDSGGPTGQKAKQVEFFRVPETLDDLHSPLSISFLSGYPTLHNTPSVLDSAAPRCLQADSAWLAGSLEHLLCSSVAAKAMVKIYEPDAQKGCRSCCETGSKL